MLVDDMTRPGRPAHPDTLTPREQEVLALLREGLTNPQIAERLSITLDGAKYHVSEILSKLGVSSREEAARWDPSERPWWATAIAPLGWAWRSANVSWLGTGAAGITAVLVVAGVGMLVWGLVRTNGDADANDDTSLQVAPTAQAELTVQADPTRAPSSPTAILATPTPAAEAIPPQPTATSGSGVAEIDRVLDAVESDGADQVEALVSFSQRPCERPEPGEIRPPIPFVECREGEATGMLVNAYWTASCEGSWWERMDAEDAQILADTIVAWDLELYGVYLPRSVADDSYVLASDYVAIFTSHQDGTVRGIGLFLLDGGIVGTDRDCGLPPAQMVELNHLSDPILFVE